MHVTYAIIHSTDEVEELSEPEFTDYADSAGISTSVVFNSKRKKKDGGGGFWFKPHPLWVEICLNVTSNVVAVCAMLPLLMSSAHSIHWLQCHQFNC